MLAIIMQNAMNCKLYSYINDLTFQEQERADGVTAEGRPLATVEENNTAAKCKKCGNVEATLLVCSVNLFYFDTQMFKLIIQISASC